MKKWIGLLLAFVAVLTMMLTAPVAEASATGCKVALQADTGKLFSRCRGCQQTIGNNPDTVTVHIDLPNKDKAYAQFEVVDVGGGKIALKSDTGKYVARCNGCVARGAYSDFLTIHVSDPGAAYAQFTPELLSNGKYALKADTGKYVSRCNGCSPTSAYPDTVTVHITDPTNAPYAQWNIIYSNSTTCKVNNLGILGNSEEEPTPNPSQEENTEEGIGNRDALYQECNS
ncbi:hypothetical protein BJP36_31290 [Moorena producens JHB]|uniref:Uncharacterized protein n=1 Tax=Moorena producens (strain JHB) TaxID=1454205 RepID=A0A1D9G7W8_MOOP1|nr:hypothetical protein [Moorena producens]AOY83739.1 hypothetical protein BJP36_31290 [Moorena producens JHB]